MAKPTPYIEGCHELGTRFVTMMLRRERIMYIFPVPALEKVTLSGAYLSDVAALIEDAREST